MDSVVKLDQAVPDFELQNLRGESFTLSSILGSIIVLNFWSAECPHSARGDSMLAERRQMWGEEVHFVSIASNANETVVQIKAEADVRKVELLLLDPDHAIADQYGAETTPHFYVIDREGQLKYHGAGDDTTWRQKEATRNYLEEAVEAVLDGRDPKIRETPGYGCTIVRYAFDEN